MKFVHLLVCFGLGMTLMSCIRDEAPNSEADIVSCTLSSDILKRDPIIENAKITITVNPEADLKHLAPEFELTPGATISPASGTALDFTSPQYYTVTSEDKNWTKKYEVICIMSGSITDYHFENVKSYTNTLLKYSYDILFENDENGNWSMDWASGNAGFALTGSGSIDKTSFPTSSTTEGKEGKGLKLVTMSTGDFGKKVGMPIAAGNLFMGWFDVASAMIDPLKATKLGVPCSYVPLYLKGYFKYKAGDVYKDVDGNVYKDVKDKWDVYVIFYETDDDVKIIDATTRFTNSHLVSIARLSDSDRVESSEWKEFYLPFVTIAGRTVDEEKLKAGKYNVAIVLSSSLDGDTFKGAVGSTLYIDELELIH